MVSPTGIAMDVAKTEAISNWTTPSNVKQNQSFIGFANFYCRFIVNFSETVTPLTRLTWKDAKFSWESEHQAAFDTLKLAFTRAPVLVHFDPANPIIVEMDASDYAIAAIISQISPADGDLHPIAFFSRGMKLAELNYEIYDKELLAIFEAFRQWRNYLEGSTHAVLVLSDHKNLEYFATTSSSPDDKSVGPNTFRGSIISFGTVQADLALNLMHSLVGMMCILKATTYMCWLTPITSSQSLNPASYLELWFSTQPHY